MEAMDHQESDEIKKSMKQLIQKSNLVLKELVQVFSSFIANSNSFEVIQKYFGSDVMRIILEGVKSVIGHGDQDQIEVS